MAASSMAVTAAASLRATKFAISSFSSSVRLSRRLLFASSSSSPKTTPSIITPLKSSSSSKINNNKEAMKMTIRSSTTSTAAPSTTTISVGDKLPESTLSYFDSAGELQTITISDLTKGKKTILFAVPGAFTPTCSQKHLPGFVEKAAELKAKGIDTIACISVNDAFVMKAWKEDLNIQEDDDVLLLSDGNGEFTRALGVELDLSDKPVGLGVRSRRYSLLAEDGIVKLLNLEEGGAFTSSGAEDILKAL